jgi:hypothetical protein
MPLPSANGWCNQPSIRVFHPLVIAHAGRTIKACHKNMAGFYRTKKSLRFLGGKCLMKVVAFLANIYENDCNQRRDKYAIKNDHGALLFVRWLDHIPVVKKEGLFCEVVRGM